MIYEIIVDAKETANKCTIAPLASREDFRLFPVFGEGQLGPLSAPILLHHEGECLSSLRSREEMPALACIDSVWRRVPRLLQKIDWVDGKQPLLAKIPGGFRTAYPRVGLPTQDPEGGLATIEALFIAAALLGNYDPTLLSKYFFARRFMELNAPRFLELGVHQAGDPALWPVVAIAPRNALNRRRNRGRAGESV